MRYFVTFAFVLSVIFGSAQTSGQTSVGLVLSGGGAKGIAHIGVLQALEDNDIPIDYITGTSMGSIVGGLYAAGYTPEEMMQLLLSKGFSDWSTGKINPGETYYFSRQAKTPAMYTISLAQNDSIAAANAVPASLISALPMNFAFMDLFAAYTAQCGGDFNKLFVPFRCIASDVEQNHKVVHRSGSLGDAIRTSMTFPIVFQPIKVDGHLLYDGGIYDNFPVETMIEDFAPDFILGVDVSSSSKGPQTSILDQIDNLVIRPQSYDVPAERGIKMRINLDNFGLLDFPAAQKIYQIGYDHAIAMIDSIRSRVGTTVPAVARRTARAVFKSHTPYVHFDADSVTITGGNAEQRRYLHYVFEPAHADTFGIADARQSYYRAISSGRLANLYPQAHYNDSTGLFNLNLHASLKGNTDIGLGGYVTSATNSFIYLSAGYNTLSLKALSAGVSGWIGQSYMAALVNADMTLHTDVPSALGFAALVSRQRYYETDRMFYDLGIPSFLISYEYYARLRYELALGWRGKMQLSAGLARLNDTFYDDIAHLAAHSDRDGLRRDIGQVRLMFDSNTLNDDAYPTVGAAYTLTASGNMGRERFLGISDVSSYQRHTQWIKAQLLTRNYFDIAKHFAFGLEGNVTYSSQKLPHNYLAAVIAAPAFNPTPASYNSFNPAFRANEFAALTLVPIYKYNSSISARLSLSGFLPFREIERNDDGTSRHGKGVGTPRFFGEMDLCYTFPFATLSGYVNYASRAPRHFNCGITFGLYITAPKFL